MKDPSALNRDRLYATLVIVIAGLAWTLGSHFPSQRLWGINHLAFLPMAARVALGIAMAVALMAVWTVPQRFARSENATRGSENPLTPVIVIGWIITAVLAHAATPLLGDGYLRADEAQRFSSGSFGQSGPVRY
jgi:hypothetical protein